MNNLRGNLQHSQKNLYVELEQLASAKQYDTAAVRSLQILDSIPF